MSYDDYHSDSDSSVHPEGKLFDPDGYDSYQRLRMLWGIIFGFFFVAALISFAASLGSSDAPVGFIVCIVLLFISGIPMGIAMKSAREAHLTSVAYEKERRAREVAENVVRANSQLNKISKQPKVKTVVNNVTLNFSDGSSFTGPFAVGENVRISYISAGEAENTDVRTALENLVKEVTKLVERLEDDGQKSAASSQLKMLVEEAKKPSPDRWSLDVSSKGLIDAAKTVAELAVPVTTAVKAVLALFAL
ncbi:hypothetical protein [Caballeronia novacaledonica]|uniref:Uncharacterized protein n=1 Tax=Caballeronia novacaledonica TaxID=1544861 RepID=A0AA37IEE3_9BURK|nr:hypothetical protein [Caballeronia novacaledonica]GJH28157.1 hypothetical protein CBA19CS42_26595 [Caballeronia novacaledonica]